MPILRDGEKKSAPAEAESGILNTSQFIWSWVMFIDSFNSAEECPPGLPGLVNHLNPAHVVGYLAPLHAGDGGSFRHCRSRTRRLHLLRAVIKDTKRYKTKRTCLCRSFFCRLQGKG